MSDEQAAAPDHAATLRAWRERGADQVDPVRFGFIEGLVRRAAAQSGAARQLLDEKIAGLMARYEEAVARSPVAPGAPVSAAAPVPAPVSAPAPSLAPVGAHAPVAPPPTGAPVPPPAHAQAPAPTPARANAPAPARGSARAAARAPAPAPARPAAPRGPLGTLADLINQRGPTPAADTSPAVLSPSSAAAPPFPPELKALDDVRNTWARLDAEQRLEQALAQVPANAGPLNSYQLVLRTLMLMREVSPEYLQRFMAHVDALMWLERTAP